MKSNPSRTLFRTLFATGLLAAGLCSCCPKHNTLTQAEIADGWQLLFDGKSLDQWKDFNGDSLTMPWHVVDGCIQAAGDGSDLSGYIVTKKQYENFILDWDWKLSYGGNSGMLYHVVENPYFKVPYVTGPEYQLIDNEGWEATNAPTRLEEWQKLGVDYAMLTDEISRSWSWLSTRQYKNLKGLKKENLRDNMTTLELVLNMLAEATTTQFSKDRKPTTFQENLEVAKAGGQVAGRTRKDIESQSNTPVISPKNAAQLNQVVTDLLEGAAADMSEMPEEK